MHFTGINFCLENECGRKIEYFCNVSIHHLLSIKPYHPLRIDAFWRIWSRQPLKIFWQMDKSLMSSNFSICQNFFNSIWWLYIHLKNISIFLRVCFQCRLLRICCMWERVNPPPQAEGFWRVCSRWHCFGKMNKSVRIMSNLLF